MALAVVSDPINAVGHFLISFANVYGLISLLNNTN